MPKARKKKAIDPFQEIQNAINGKMHRQHTAHMFICKHDLDQVWADHPLRTIFPSFSQDECDSTRQSYICVLSILVYAKWADLRSRFRPLFLREDGRDDTHLPFKNLDFLGDFAPAFSSYQQAFKPAIIEERNERYIQSIPPERRLPFIGEPEPLGKGGYGSVTKRVIAPRCLWSKRDNKENKEPTLVACKIYRNEIPSQDFKREVGNLDYIREGLTDCKRVMKHIAAIVHGAEFMIILPHANLHNLEFFLRGGYKPHPGTDKLKKIYDFDVEFCMLDTPVKLQRALVEEAHQLASALKWLHEDLKLFGSSNRYLAHMDLKPANVLLVGDPESPAGKWMLSDFGVSSFDKATNARVQDTPSIYDVGLSLTSRGLQDKISRGHGSFQPPEVELANVDSRKCDLWSFGCVLCDILAFAIGKTDAVYRFRNLRYDASNDYFYRTTTPAETRITEIDDSNTELKTQIVQWWKTFEDDISCPIWVTDYIKILREALRPKPSDRSRITDIVNGLNKLAPSITSQESGGLASEPKISSTRPQPNGSALQHTLEAHEKRPSITVSSELSPPHRETVYRQDAATEGKDHSLPSANSLSPGTPLPRQPGFHARHMKDGSQSSPSIESQNDSATNGRGPLSSSDEPSSERRTASISTLAFREGAQFPLPLAKRKDVKAVAIAPSALQVAVLCKHSVHLYSTTDGPESGRHIDLSPNVDWKKIRLASHYFAVYGLGLSKHIEIFDSQTSEATIRNNDELAQDILLSDKEVFAYVYGQKVKLHFARHNKDLEIPISGDDPLIIEAKFSPSGKILCVWATGTRAEHAYFFEVNEDSASLCGKGSYQKTNTNPFTCEIWPFFDSPACVIHEAHGGTFLAQPLVQSEPQQRDPIGISKALTACVIREDLLLCLRSRTFHSRRLLCGFALSQESQGQRRIADQCRVLCVANKGIEKSTASAVHLVDGRIELVLCTITGKILRYVEFSEGDRQTAGELRGRGPSPSPSIPQSSPQLTAPNNLPNTPPQSTNKHLVIAKEGSTTTTGEILRYDESSEKEDRQTARISRGRGPLPNPSSPQSPLQLTKPDNLPNTQPQSMIKHLAIGNERSTSRISTQLLRMMKTWLRPNPRPGLVRITWTCGCGEEMYADVKEQRPGSSRDLQARLRSSAEEAIRHRREQLFRGSSFQQSSNDIRTLKSPSKSTNTGTAASDNHNNDRAMSTVVSASTSTCRNGQGNTCNPSVQERGLLHSQDITESRQQPNATLQAASVCKLLLCINQDFLPSMQPTCLEQIDLTGITNDQYFFERMCASYKQARKKSYWRLGNMTLSQSSLLSWWPKDWTLFVPSAALYVKVLSDSPLTNVADDNSFQWLTVSQFDLVPSRPDGSQGPISLISCPRVLRWNVLPPKEQCEQGNYNHHPCPNDDNDLISNQFIHTMLRPGEPHTSSFWLHEAPKKTKETLPQRYGTFGWGILIVEGPNWKTFVVLSFAMVSLITLIAIIYSAVGEDVSRGFGIGSYLVGALGVELAVLIMIANMSFSPSKMTGTGK